MTMSVKSVYDAYMGGQFPKGLEFEHLDGYRLERFERVARYGNKFAEERGRTVHDNWQNRHSRVVVDKDEKIASLTQEIADLKEKVQFTTEAQS